MASNDFEFTSDEEINAFNHEDKSMYVFFKTSMFYYLRLHNLKNRRFSYFFFFNSKIKHLICMHYNIKIRLIMFYLFYRDLTGYIDQIDGLRTLKTAQGHVLKFVLNNASHSQECEC